MDLVRDLLDKQIVDRNGQEMGRVDAVVLHISDGDAPRVVALEVGAAVLASRIAPVFGRLVAALEQVFQVADGHPLRIPVGKVRAVDDRVTVDLAFGDTAAAAIEQRLRRWVGAIPGAS